MRSSAARPRTWTSRRRASGSAWSTGVSASSKTSRSSTTSRDSAIRRRRSSARGSGSGGGGATGSGALDTGIRRRKRAKSAAAIPAPTSSHATRLRIGAMLHCPPLLAPPRAVTLPEQRRQAEPPKTERRGGIGELRTEYEILLMLDPDAPEERQNEILERARELVERGGGTWDRHEPWGRRRLAYEIAHKEDGVYHLFEFTAEPD